MAETDADRLVKELIDFLRRRSKRDEIRSDPGDDNFPGYRYASRVAGAVYRTYQASTEEINDAWAEARRGRYDFSSAAKTWTTLTEGYWKVFYAALRSPSDVARPAWLVVTYNLNTQPPKIYPVRIDDLDLEDKPELETTDFFGISRPDRGATHTQPASVAKEYFYDAEPKIQGRGVVFSLNEKIPDLIRADKVRPGEYMGLVLRKGCWRCPPLVILTLRLIQ